MTKAAQAFGKHLDNFWATESTSEYIEALDEVYSPIAGDLIQAKRGHKGGTWGHPKLAVFFARWFDAKFGVWCDSVIEDILTKKAEVTITKPFHA